MTARDVELRRRGRLIAERVAARSGSPGESYLAFGAACAAEALAAAEPSSTNPCAAAPAPSIGLR